MIRHAHASTQLTIIMRSQDNQLALCDELEAVADDLPSNVDRQRCLHLARALCPIIASSQELEERLLFNALEGSAVWLADLSQTLERLRYEHYEDLCFAEELHDALLALGRGEDRLSADVVGYMLRGFFEAVRRHVAFERELLAPLLDRGTSAPN